MVDRESGLRERRWLRERKGGAERESGLTERVAERDRGRGVEREGGREG